MANLSRRAAAAGFVVLLAAAWVHAFPGKYERRSTKCERSYFVPRTSYFSGPTWTPIDSPGTEPHRSWHACCWDPVHDMVYLYGGSPDYSATSVALCQRYNPASNTWSDMAPMKTARQAIKGIYCRGKLYAIGGYSNADQGIDSCEAYDIATNAWAPIARLPAPLYSYQAVTWNDSLIYILGGHDGGPAGNQVYIYNPRADTWVSGDTMLVPCDMGDAAIIGDTLYFAGGCNADGNLDTVMRIGVIDHNNPTRITWSWGPRLPAARYCGPTIAAQGKIYWFGGLLSAGAGATSAGYVYDPGTGAITALSAYPVKVADCCLATFQDSTGEIYGLAGDQGDNSTPAGYYQMGIPGYYDVGPTKLIAPPAEVDSGDAIIPAAMVANFGKYPESFPVMSKIENFYVDYETTSVLPGQNATVLFAPWTVNCRGSHVVTCSTMMADDNQPQNNAMSETLVAYAFNGGVVGLYLPDTIPTGAFTPIALVQNYGPAPGLLLVDWWIFQDDTLPVYARSESTWLPGNAQQQVPFPPWNASLGHYLAEVFGVRNGQGMHDTISKRTLVLSEGIVDPPPAYRPPLTATIVRGVLTIAGSSQKTGGSDGAELLDISGRKVLDLKPGSNDVSRLAPGVYFILEQPQTPSFKPHAIWKVVLTR
jgi:N-acetylneuraminic acid mutarotase